MGVAVKDIQFGLVRAWEIMTKIDEKGVRELQTMSFGSRADAIEWLINS